MTDLVVGGGSVGTFLAWALATGGRDVAIVRRRHDGPPRAAEVTVIDRGGERRTTGITEVARPGDLMAPPSVLIFAVKMFDLAGAVETCAAWPGAVGLTVANGVGAEGLVAAARPDAGLIAGSVTVSLEPADSGAVARLNEGGITLAPVQGEVSSAVDELVGAFRAGGLQADRLPDAAAMKWSKLLANLVGNATSAIVDLAPADVYGDGDAFRVERRQLREALAVMSRLGLRPVRLPGANVPMLAVAARLPSPIGRLILGQVVGGARGGKDPSLRIHVRTGSGLSEVAWLNGAVAAEASRLGGSAPVNRRLAELVQEVSGDAPRRAWFRGRLDRLVAAIDGRRPAVGEADQSH
jgi:2-dehydropantoate 2-reductase